MFGNYLENVRINQPLIHNITNYVTVNDVANVLLASGARPIMADDPEEAAPITAICAGLNLNIGTLNQRTVSSMIKAGIKANELGHVVSLDPVGAGASPLRTNTALDLLEKIHFDVIRGNISEIRTLVCGSGTTLGVDANEAEAITPANLDVMVAFAKNFAAQTGAIIAITGAIDLVADEHKCYVIYNGVAPMSTVTGTGCQLSSLTCAFLAANPQARLEAVAAAVLAMGRAGEIALEMLQPGEGNATYRNRIIDAIATMEGITLDQGAKYEIK